MRYQNPEILYFLFAIAIPILIHLFNFRKHKTVYFSSVRFLKKIKEKHHKQSKLKNIFILISRILAISFLVLAFSKPYIPNTEKAKDNILIYIDNSLSMDVDYGDGNLLNKAKNKALQIAKAYSIDTKYFLITNDFYAKHNNSYDSDAIKSQIESIKSSAKQKTVSEIISRMDILSKKSNHLYFISDMQKNTTKINDLEKIKEDNKISLIPLRTKEISNISIDSCFTSSPIFISENEIEIKVILSNQSKKDVVDEILFLYIDNKQKSQQYISLLAGEKKEISFQLLTHSKKSIIGEIRINDSPISYDNNFFFTLNRSNKINIAVINDKDKNTALSVLLERDTFLFNYSSFNIRNINYNTLLKKDLIILNAITTLNTGLLNSIELFVQNGGNILIIPPANLENLLIYNIMLKSLGINTIEKTTNYPLKINKFKFEHPIYKNVFKKEIKNIHYPSSKKSYTLKNTIPKTKIIDFENNNSFLSSYSIKEGIIYQLSNPLDTLFNNFTKHALFVPTLINIATSSIQSDAPYYIININEEINNTKKEITNDIPHITGNNTDIIPTIKNKHGKQLLNIHNNITKSGIYNLEYKNRKMTSFAFNYNKSESKLNSYSSKDIEKLIRDNKLNNISLLSSNQTNLTTLIKEKENGKEYWRISLILSLIFFAVEILLIKLLKL